MMKLIYYILFVSSLLYAEPKIEWNLENPFKFFKEKKSYWEMHQIYHNSKKIKNQYENSIGLAFERNMQSAKWKKGSYTEHKNSSWAAYFAEDFDETTEWNLSTRLYNKNYTKIQKEYKIKVRLLDVKSNDCYWQVDKKKYPKTSCTEIQVLTVPSGTNNNLIQVHWNNDANNVNTIIEGGVKDILIVGLGDSFGSGEGNPDIPIKTDNMTKNLDVVFTKNMYLPRKEKNNSAIWLDRRAHRSLYSYQFKTALHYSLEHPKEMVTFVNFSSSGAVTDNIIDIEKKAIEKIKSISNHYHNEFTGLDFLEGKEDKSINRKSYILPQLHLLCTILKNNSEYKNSEEKFCEREDGDRKADIILLSTGGNDVGFVKYIMNILGVPFSKKPTKETANEVDFTLSENYYKLNNLLKHYVKDPKRIVLTTYPEILKDENGDLCKGNQRTMNIPFGVRNDREQKIKDTHTYLVKPLYNTQKQLAKELGWSFVDKHRTIYEKHGFCAKNQNNLQSIQEQFVMPHKYKKGEDWLPFEPKEYKAYKKKQRWVQLPVDSLLMINMTQDFLWFRADFLFSDERSGLFHPTADGLAVMADETGKIITPILEK